MLVQGIAKWAKVYPNHYDKHKKYGDKWTINLVVSEKDAKRLLGQGLNSACANWDGDKKSGNFTPKPNEDGSWEFRFTRKLTIKQGTVKKTPPVVLDAMKQPFDKPIGNGSKVVVQYTTYTFDGNVYDDLQGVQVLELVSHSSDGDEFEKHDTSTAEFVDETEGTTEDNPFE